MVITMMLSNNKGISLIVLVIAMTLIAILGTSFVALMSSKQKGFLYQIDSYRALNLANAGVEYAIRFASDGTDVNGNSIFFSNQTLTMSRNYSGGSFSTSYTYNQNIASDILTVIGTYPVGGGSTKQITLTRFRRYLSPISLIPNAGQIPSYRTSNRRFLDVPVIGNHDSVVTVVQIDLTTGISGMLLRYIDGPGGRIFDYATSNYTACNIFVPVPPCNYSPGGFSLGILLPSSTMPISAPNLATGTINPDTTYNYVFEFTFPAPSPAPLHTVKFYSAPVASELKFTP
jgi:hypothetical protein